MGSSERSKMLRRGVIPAALVMFAILPYARGQSQTASSPAVSSAGEITIKAIPHPLSWIKETDTPPSGQWGVQASNPPVSQPKDFRVLSDDAFSITAAKGTDLYNDAGTGAITRGAPMLAFTPDEAFVLTAKVAPDFRQEFDAGFLIVYVDATHWAKLLFEKSHYRQLQVGSSVTDTVSDDSVNADVPGHEVYLRIAKSKDVYTFYYSPDGRRWQYIRYFKFAGKGALRVGFASQSPEGEQCATVFSNIGYVAKAPGDFWTGEPGK